MSATDTLARRSKREREQGNRASRLLRALGPGLITGASDEFKVNGGLMIVGWIATAVMAGAAAAMCFTAALSAIEM
jgi:hypothetical protein